MKQTKSNSYNSTPFSCKENICPNARFNTLKQKPQQRPSPSLKTDPEFSVFNTINVQRSSRPSMTTKSRADVEAIVQDIGKTAHYDKSFLQLLGIAVGKEEISVREAIQRCEQFQISCRQQLLSLLQQKQPSRQWPLPLSNLLLTDLGQLKVKQLCERLATEQDLSDQQMQILQFLIPKAQFLDHIDQSVVLDHYFHFRNSIDEKFNVVDSLVKIYTLRIQPKIRGIRDKICLIKVQKKLRKFQKLGKTQINFIELQSCLEGLKLTEAQLIVLFKYLYFLQHDKVMEVIERKLFVSIQTCIGQLFQKQHIPFAKQTISRVQLMGQENNRVINDLLQDKTHLLQDMQQKDQQILKLKNQNTILKLKLQNQVEQCSQQKRREIQALKNRQQEQFSQFSVELQEKDRLIEWYRNQLQAAVRTNRIEGGSIHSRHIFRTAFTSLSKEQNDE